MAGETRLLGLLVIISNIVALFAMINTVRSHYALLIVLNKLPSVALTIIDSEAQVRPNRDQRQRIGK
jgi:hypothetical protein